MKAETPGSMAVAALVGIVIASDTAGYFAGRAVGGPKFWPAVSPNKTWSGIVGGLVAATLAGFLCSRLLGDELGGVAGAVIGLFGGLATMGGDLWESMLKRRFGVKDSGDLIPGHGGLRDRVDGLMFAVIVLSIARLAELLA